MKRDVFWTLVLSLCLASLGRAQTVTGSGTTGTIPMWTNTQTLGDSVIVQGSDGSVNVDVTSKTGIFGATSAKLKMSLR